MSNADLEVTEEKANNVEVAPKVTPELTDESALAVIRKQEAKIKKAAKKRSYSPASPEAVKDAFLFNVSALTIVIPAVSVFITPVILLATAKFVHIEPDLLDLLMDALLFGGIGTAFLNTISAGSGVTRRISAVVLRKKLQKKLAENEAEHRLWELKENEYKKVEKKALAKSQPALDYLNSKMGTEEIAFSSYIGKEGLVIKERDLDVVDKISVKILSVGQEPPVKSLTELTKETPLSITQKEPVNV